MMIVGRGRSSRAGRSRGSWSRSYTTRRRRLPPRHVSRAWRRHRVYPTYDDMAYRIELWGDEIESLSQVDPVVGRQAELHASADLSEDALRHEDETAQAVESIKKELAWWKVELSSRAHVEAQRNQRTMFDLK